MSEQDLHEEMRPIPRSLTQEEIQLAKSLFKDSVRYEKVKIYNAKYVGFQQDETGMTPFGEMWIVGAKTYRENYGIADVPLQAFFIHEMVHVWQYQNNVLSVLGSAIEETITLGLGNYMIMAYPYKLEPNKDLMDYRMEQQGAIMENYYRYKNKVDFRLTYVQNTERGGALMKLHEDVLKKFLQDPHYARNYAYRNLRSTPGFGDR